MEVNLINSKKTVNLTENVFDCRFNESLVHQAVTAYLAGGRAGTKAQKTRSEVSGGGAKPFRQKGTGRARAGTIRSPLWRTGGIVFAAKPRDYKQKINKKMYRGAIRSIVSELLRQNRLHVVDAITIEQPKTKLLLNALDKLKISGNVLIVSDDVDENLYLSARNLHNVNIADVSVALSDPVSLISADNVIITESAVVELQRLLT